MPKSKPWLLLAAITFLITTPVAAQTPPITFQDPQPGTAVWPNPVEATVLNNTTETLMVTIQVTDLEDAATGATVSAGEVFLPLAPSVTIPPAGQAALALAANPAFAPNEGRWVGSLVLSVPSHNAVLRKPIALTIAPSTSAPGPAPGLVPAVDSWTINAVRVLPFVDPVCLRGLLAGCTIPLATATNPAEAPPTLGYLAGEAGGALILGFEGLDPGGDARVSLAFDRRWGFAGTYAGSIKLADTTQPQVPDPNAVDVTVRVTDIVLWPILAIVAGILAARQLQYQITVRKRTSELLNRLGLAELSFAKLRKSVHGYTVSEDFQQQRDDLESRIRRWDQTHYGEPTAEERRRLESEILHPLGQLEHQLSLWRQFREKLDRLGRRLLQDAQPAIRGAARPADVELEEPRFYTAARLLLRGTKLQMSQVPGFAERVDDAAELAGKWGELSHLADIVREAIRQLSRPEVELSESEAEMLETARHHLNSAARDLWEAQDLADLRAREAEAELVIAQDLARRLLDPFVYYAGSEPPPQAEEDASATTEEAASGTAEAFSPQRAEAVPPMVRTFARIDTYRLPRLTSGVGITEMGDESRTSEPDKGLLFGERTVTAAATIVALLWGLAQYVTTNFGTVADYLALFIAGLAAKVGLEAANLVASWIRLPRD